MHGVRGQGYISEPPLPEVRAVNREFVERQKERKDAEKRRCERKRKDKEVRDKVNRALEKQGKSPILTPDSTPEPESPPSAEVEVDYSALPDPKAEGTRGQPPSQQHVGTEPPTQVEGEDELARSLAERPPAQPVAGTLG